MYKVIIPARANSKRLPGKNMRILGSKPLIGYSIQFALNSFLSDSVWVNSNDQKVLNYAKRMGVKTLERPNQLATDYTSTIDVLKHQIKYFEEKNIECDAIILLQPTSPFRQANLIKKAINEFEKSQRDSLATFSILSKKIGLIENNLFKPINYKPGQRSQDLSKIYHENGLLYITKSSSILKGDVITDNVHPFICQEIESSIDIDTIEDFNFAELMLKTKYNGEIIY